MPGRGGRRRGGRRRSRTTAGYQPPVFTICIVVNVTLTASTYHYWTSEGADSYTRATSLEIRAASSTPCTIQFRIERSQNPNAASPIWETLWTSATGIIGTNAQLIKLRAPRLLLPALAYRWGAISAGTPVLAGWVRFSKLDPQT